MNVLKTSLTTLIIFTFILLIPLCANAATPPPAEGFNPIVAITDQFGTNMAAWYAPIKEYAAHIFWILVTIDVVWTLGRLAFSKADMGDFMIELLKQLITIGIFWSFLSHSEEWATAMVNSWKMIGNKASGVHSLEPYDVFNAGVTVCTTILKTFTFTLDPAKIMNSIALVFAGFMVLISFSLMAALEIVVSIETYFFMYIGVIFLAFGGHSFTSDIAKRYFFSLIGIGAKLMVMQIVTGMGIRLIQSWSDLVALSQGPPDMQILILIAGGSIAFLALTKMAPDLFQSVTNTVSAAAAGHFISSGMAAGSIGSAVMMGTAAGISAAAGNPALAQQFGRAAVDQGGEAYRHSTGHHGTNMLDRFPGYKGEDGQKPENTGFSGANYKPENWYGGSSHNSISGSSSSESKATANNEQN